MIAAGGGRGKIRRQPSLSPPHHSDPERDIPGPLSGGTGALTGIVHHVNVGPQFRAAQVVAVLDRVIQGRQQDEEDHGVDELREGGEPTRLPWKIHRGSILS